MSTACALHFAHPPFPPPNIGAFQPFHQHISKFGVKLSPLHTHKKTAHHSLPSNARYHSVRLVTRSTRNVLIPSGRSPWTRRGNNDGRKVRSRRTSPERGQRWHQGAGNGANPSPPSLLLMARLYRFVSANLASPWRGRDYVREETRVSSGSGQGEASNEILESGSTGKRARLVCREVTHHMDAQYLERSVSLGVSQPNLVCVPNETLESQHLQERLSRKCYQKRVLLLFPDALHLASRGSGQFWSWGFQANRRLIYRVT